MIALIARPLCSLLLAASFASAAAYAAPQDGVVTGAIYRADSSSTSRNAAVPVATAVAGLQVYLRPVDKADWLPPVTTDAYGRFVVRSVTPGRYQMRAYSGRIRVWDQNITAPAVLPNIIVRDVVVGYYFSPSDGERVNGVLASLGFPYELRDKQIPTPTNSIWFGDSVRPSDVNALAIALTRAGVAIRQIRRFANGKGEKARLIEIGAAAAKANSKPITVDEISRTPDWPRDSG